jgi:hypothetical protein
MPITLRLRVVLLLDWTDACQGIISASHYVKFLLISIKDVTASEAVRSGAALLAEGKVVDKSRPETYGKVFDDRPVKCGLHLTARPAFTDRSNQVVSSADSC